MERPIDVLCEEERLRRLSERVTFDGGDSAEPARQRRARILVEEMTTLGPRLRSKSNEDRRFKAIRALEAGLHARWKAVVHEMSEGHKGPSERVRKAAEEDLERTAVPVPTPHPTIPEDIHSKLLDALEGVTVRAVVGLRGLTEVPPNVEAVTLAVLHLVSCEYLGQMGLGPEAPENWEEARRVLLKPGHFVSSLRKFPSSLEQGQVNDSNIIFAQKKLLQIGNAASTGLAEVHEGAVQLYHWLRAALQLAPSSLVAAAASPARASASPLDPLQPAYPRSAPSSPQHKKEEVKPSPSKTTPKAAPVRPMSPKAAYRTPLAAKSVSNGYHKSPNNSATSATISTSRSAGFNLSWSTLSAGTGGAAKSQPKPSRVSTTGVSPRRRSSPSPTPALTGKQPVVSSKGVYVAKAQPLRPRNSLNGTASPQPTRPQAKDLEVKPPSFARSRSAGRETKSQEVVATGGSNLSFASISTAAMPTSKDFAGIRIRLDQEKKEVRQMRGMESQLKWDMLREERNQTEEERREEARRIMEWRDREAKEMREYVEGKSRDQRLHELLESKEYQEFKRAWKQAMRKEEIERIKVQLAENLDNAQWRLELQRALDLDRQMALQENMEAQQELRELKEKERQREKVMQEEDRVHDLTLEYAHQAQQISTEKEALLRSLALLRERQKAPVAGTATKAGTTIWPLAQ